MDLKKIYGIIDPVLDDISKKNLTGIDFQDKYSKIKNQINKLIKIFEETKQILNMINSGEVQGKISDDYKKKISDIISDLEIKLIPKINNARQKESIILNNGDEGTYEQEQQNKENQKELAVQQEIQNKDKYLEKRKEELEKIHKAAAKIRDITNLMSEKVEKQREQLNEIEANVDTVKENVIEAKKETMEAEKSQRKNNKRICCLVIIILLAIGGVTGIVLSLLP